MVVDRSLNDAHRENDQNDQKRALGDRARRVMIVLRKEEQSTQAELLDIKPNKNMLDRLGEEESTGFA